MNTRKVLEHSGVIQATVEGLSLQQIHIRDGLMNRYGMSVDDATAVVRGERELADFGIMGEESPAAS